MNKIEKVFYEFEDEYLEFDRIKNKLSNRADMHALMLLDSLFPNDKHDMISAVEHDEIYLDISPKKLVKVATKEQIRDLIRCGVRYSDENESLVMFV